VPKEDVIITVLWVMLWGYFLGAFSQILMML
jgi:hypothetical protein